MEENILLPFPSDYDEKLKVSSLDPNTEVEIVASSKQEVNYSQALDFIWSLPQSISKDTIPEGVEEILISRTAKKKLVYQMSNLYNEARFAYMQAIPYIEELVQNSILLEEHRDRVKNDAGVRHYANEEDRNVDKVQRLYGAFQHSSQLYRVKTTIQVFKEAQGTSIHHGYDITEIELLNQTGSSEKFLEVHQSLNSNSIGELLSPIPCVMENSPAGNKVLNNSSIDEMLAPKAERSQRESFQPLTSNSTDELLNPKTATPIEGRLQPLNSNSISLAKLLKGVELSYEPNVKLLDAMQACHQFALTGDYTELVKVYDTARNKRLSTTLSDPLQSVKQAQAEMVASTQQATHVVVPSSPIQEKAQAILNARGERNDNTLKNAQEEQVERKNQSHKL